MSAEKTLRWLHLFDLLAAHPGGLSVRQLHSGLGQNDAMKACARRSFGRDLEEMSLSGVIGLCNPDPNVLPPGWALQPNALGGRTLSAHGDATFLRSRDRFRRRPGPHSKPIGGDHDVRRSARGIHHRHRTGAIRNTASPSSGVPRRDSARADRVRLKTRSPTVQDAVHSAMREDKSR